MNGKKWSKAQREKFAATMAAKSAPRKRITRTRDISLQKIGPGLYLLNLNGKGRNVS